MKSENMKREKLLNRIISCLAVVALAACATADRTAPAHVSERPDLSHYFSDAGTDGTIVIFDPRTKSAVVVNAARADRGYLPASTFKIPNSLIGLEIGAVSDVETELFPWNGTTFLIDGQDILPKGCNADIPLRTAFRLSCVQVYQQLARRIGSERFDHWLAAFDYGNHDIGGAPVDLFWLEGNLRISAWQQVAFLTRLAAGDLPVSARALSQVRTIMTMEKSATTTLYAKTGYASALGWWVGWVEKDGETRIFALNLDMPRFELGKARMEIGKAVLRDLGAL
jgi:beta-lactamase class D